MSNEPDIDAKDRPSWGRGADAELEGANDTVGRPGMHHWQQSTITVPGLEDRGDVFFAAIEMTRMPMVLSDPRQADNPIVFANNAFLDLTGYETAEILGRNCRFLQGAGTDRETVLELRTAIAEKRAVSLEILNYRRDGTSFWNAVFMGPVFDPAGELLYFFASQLDVTRRRESEQAYRQSQKMEAIGQLTAGLAHDFNNLLHVVTGSLERMQARPDDPAAFQRYMKAAMTAAERGAKLTQQLLAFGRRSRLEPQSVEVSNLVTSISELLDSSVGERAHLNLHLRRRLPEIHVDPVHLEMALINVLVNARDASEVGGEITITTEEVRIAEAALDLDRGRYVVVSVQDRGTGMPPHVKVRATEPFFTTKAVGEGTGLGLAMAHGFTKQSGGHLEIVSEPGQGTTIRMFFPVKAAKAAAGVPATEDGYHPSRVDQEAPPSILIVEDSVEIAALARETLVEAGYQVVVAHSGEAALKLFADAQAGGKFDLVFSDIIMPGGMNGLVLAKHVREHSPATPILVTTGYNDEMALDGPKPEAMDVLGKPYRQSELLDRVQSALRRGARTGPDRQTSSFGVAEA